MRRSGGPPGLHDEVARFQAEVERLAFAAVRAVIEEELARRRAKPEAARPRKVRSAPREGRSAARTSPQLELGLVPTAPGQLDLPLASRAAAGGPPPAEPPAEPPREHGPTAGPDAVAAPATEATQAPGAPEPPPDVVPAGGRARWTRERIVSELATWMLSGTAIDAQFMTRHGPKGLVAAIRRVFGRFEAAMNVAALHNSKLYPDGPPARGASPGRRTALPAEPPPEPE